MLVLNNFINDSRIIREANTLGKNGFKVKVMALHQDGLKTEEDFECFRVERIPLKTRSWGKRRFIQILKYLEFFIKAVIRGLSFQPDIIHCHDITPLPVGYMIMILLKRNPVFIYDSHELWSHASGVINRPGITRWVLRKMEHFFIRKADYVVTVSESIAHFLKKQDNLERTPYVIRNLPEKKEVQRKSDILKKELGIATDKKIVLYQGAISKGRGLENIIKAIPYFEEKIIFVIIGGGPLKKKLQEMVNTTGIKNRVYFLDFVPYDRLLDFTNSAYLGIAAIENYCLSYYFSLPNKLFEYIQAEIPVVCSDFPEMKNVILDNKLGKVFNPEDPKEIAEVVNELLNDEIHYEICLNNVRKVKSEFCWEEEEKKLLEIYEGTGV